MKIGARVLKTGIAIALSIYASLILLPGSTGALAGIAAGISTQPSVKKSFETFILRVFANTIGGITAVVMVFAIGNSPIAIGVTAIVTIAILNSVKLGDVISLTIVTSTVIMLSNTDDYIITAVLRVSETFLGVLISFLINWLIHPPKHDAQFFKILESTTNESLMLLRATLRKNTDFSIMNRDLKWLNRQMTQFSSLFELMRQEWIFSKKQRNEQARRLVIYRYMGKTTQAAIDLLHALHQGNQVYDDFPEEFLYLYRERIEILLTAHEQIIMKFYGKVPPEEVNYMAMNFEHRDEYLNMFFEQVRVIEQMKEKHLFEGNSVIHIMSASFRYEEHLDNLNRLIRTYKLHGSGEEYDPSHDDNR